MRTRAIASFTEFVKAMPENIWLNDISQEGDDLLLQGKVEGTFQALSEYRNVLMESGHLQNVEIVSADELKTDDEVENLRSFAVKVTLKGLKPGSE